MRFWIVTVVAFTALFVTMLAALMPDTTFWFATWVIGLLVIAVAFPYYGYLLSKR